MITVTPGLMVSVALLVMKTFPVRIYVGFDQVAFEAMGPLIGVCDEISRTNRIRNRVINGRENIFAALSDVMFRDFLRMWGWGFGHGLGCGVGRRKTPRVEANGTFGSPSLAGISTGLRGEPHGEARCAWKRVYQKVRDSGRRHDPSPDGVRWIPANRVTKVATPGPHNTRVPPAWEC